MIHCSLVPVFLHCSLVPVFLHCSLVPVFLNCSLVPVCLDCSLVPVFLHCSLVPVCLHCSLVPVFLHCSLVPAFLHCSFVVLFIHPSFIVGVYVLFLLVICLHRCSSSHNGNDMWYVLFFYTLYVTTKSPPMTDHSERCACERVLSTFSFRTFWLSAICCFP